MLSGMAGLFIGMRYWGGNALHKYEYTVDKTDSCKDIINKSYYIIQQIKPDPTRYTGINHLPVKSVSNPDSMASAFSHVHDASGRAPHGHEAPLTAWFSLLARSQVHWPTGRDPM